MKVLQPNTYMIFTEPAYGSIVSRGWGFGFFPLSRQAGKACWGTPLVLFTSLPGNQPSKVILRPLKPAAQSFQSYWGKTPQATSFLTWLAAVCLRDSMVSNHLHLKHQWAQERTVASWVEGLDPNLLSIFTTTLPVLTLNVPKKLLGGHLSPQDNTIQTRVLE